MDNQPFESQDLVSVQGVKGVWIIVGTRDPEPRFQIQLGRDAATVRWVATETLSLVQKAPKQDSEPGFYPGRSSFMD
jgi:hypothetical protein